MTDRFGRLLDRLARFLLIGVAAAPLLLVAAQSIIPRPDVQWAVSVPWFGIPHTWVAVEERYDSTWGSAIVVTNEGNVESEDVQIVLGASLPAAPAQPSYLEVGGRSMMDVEQILTEEGMIIDLGPMAAGERLEVIIYGVSWMDVDEVLHGDEPIERTVPTSMFDPRIRLPLWSLLAGLFLLAGVVVQNLALRTQGARGRPS